MSTKGATKLELARLEATEKDNEHRRRMELMNAETAREEAAHRREMERKQKELEIKEREERAEEADHQRALELQKEALELAKAKQDGTANPNNPSPGTVSHPRKFPTFKAGDDTEAFLENFERTCLGYNISAYQYMIELRPQLSGPLAEVAAEMPKAQMNEYKLFQTKARIRMGLTPEHACRETINPLQAKVDAIQKWPVPKSKKQVQSFLGLAGYYRRLVPHYSQIAAPLTDLTRKTQPNAVKWTDECPKAFTHLKATFMSNPVLRAPDFAKPFLVITGASKHSIGAVLMQEGPDQNFHPVMFLSKKLCERESHWSISEKECYALETFGDGFSSCKLTMLR
ncbi:uncharacterized protein ACDP82_013796 isoform 1-T2 [Pangshura tecta]